MKKRQKDCPDPFSGTFIIQSIILSVCVPIVSFHIRTEEQQEYMNTEHAALFAIPHTQTQYMYV